MTTATQLNLESRMAVLAAEVATLKEKLDDTETSATVEIPNEQDQHNFPLRVLGTAVACGVADASPHLKSGTYSEPIPK